MATAHLIHGYLGAGKTTLARQLEAELPALRFSHDEWMAKLFGEDPPEASFAENHNRVWDLMASIWRPALALGVDVILDFGFWRRAERDSVRAQVLSTGSEVRLYSLTCSDEEAWHRIERRNLALDGALLITRNTFEVLRARFEHWRLTKRGSTIPPKLDRPPSPLWGGTDRVAVRVGKPAMPIHSKRIPHPSGASRHPPSP